MDQCLPRYFAYEIRSLLDFAAQPTLLAMVGIDGPALDDPEAMIPPSVYYDLLERAAAVTVDPNFGLHFAVHWHDLQRGGQSAMGVLTRSSPNLRVMCERLVRFQRRWNAEDWYEVAESGTGFHMRYRSLAPWREAHRHMAEKTAAGIVACVRDLQPSCRPLAVRFPYRSTGDSSELTRILGVEPMYGGTSTEVALPLAVMDIPLPTANAVLFWLSDHYLSMRLGRSIESEPSCKELVRNTVQQLLGKDGFGQKTIARVLGLGGRTLQRRLAKEGTTLREIVDEVRKSRARELVDAHTTSVEMASFLGYSEPASFHHAFRRWYGMSPKSWRNAAVGSQFPNGRS